MNLFGVGPTELLVVLVVVLILFGPDRLPEIAKRIGGASRELKNNLDSINDQMNEVLESSMESDKARMTPPAASPTTAEGAAPPAQLPEPQPTNSILPPARGASDSPAPDTPREVATGETPADIPLQPTQANIKPEPPESPPHQ